MVGRVISGQGMDANAVVQREQRSAIHIRLLLHDVPAIGEFGYQRVVVHFLRIAFNILSLHIGQRLQDSNKLLPPNGVYRTVVVSKHMSYPAITNIGVNPTVEDTKEIRVESHILNFKDDLYGEIIEVRFYEFIRPEKKFQSVDELKEQIMKDMSQLLKQ